MLDIVFCLGAQQLFGSAGFNGVYINVVSSSSGAVQRAA